MKTLIARCSLAILLSAVAAFPQTAKQDAKDAGKDVKQAGKDTGRAVSKTTKHATHKVKRGVHRTADKVSDKTKQ